MENSNSKTRSPTRAPSEPKATSEASRLVSVVNASMTLVPPRGCCASVLLKLVEPISGHGRKDKRLFAWWTMAGSHKGQEMQVEYIHDEIDTVRIDIPEGASICTSYLQRLLREYWEEGEELPPDTPVVKG